MLNKGIFLWKIVPNFHLNFATVYVDGCSMLPALFDKGVCDKLATVVSRTKLTLFVTTLASFSH